MTNMKYIVRKTIPLYDGNVFEFSVDWCHARTLPVEAARQKQTGIAEVDGDLDGAEANGEEEDEPSGYLEVSFWGTLPTEAHRSSDAGLLSRPHLLRILSLLSYFSGSVYDVRSPIRTVQQYLDREPVLEVSTEAGPELMIRGVDRSADLATLLRFVAVDDPKGFVASLLDRWRKGSFLLRELEETAADEAALCFFHILEAIGHHYKSVAVAEIKALTNLYVEKLMDQVYLQDGVQREQISTNFCKEIDSVVTAQESFGIGVLISYALSRMGLLSAKTRALVGRLVKFRNDVAHARPAAVIRRSTWPAPSFFFQTDPREDGLVEILQVLSARAIAAFTKITMWAEEWNDCEAALHPPDSLILEFVSQKHLLSPEAFERGEVLGVRPSSITNYWLSKRKRLELKWLESALGAYVLQASPRDANVDEFLMAAILLADSENDDIARAAKQKVGEVFVRRELGLKHPSDIFKEFLRHDVEPVWFRSWARRGSPGVAEGAHSKS